MAALRAGETSKAWRAFSECERLAATVPERHRGGALFAAGLLLLETTLRVGQTQEAELLQRTLALRSRAQESGAWAQELSAALRLRTLVLIWRLAPEGGFARQCPDADREWLLRDDFFELAPERLPPLHGAARVLRLQLAIGGGREAAALHDLAVHEEAVARAVADGEDLAPEDRQWREAGLSALCRYHLERRSLDRAQMYAERLPPEASRDVRSLLALQREDHDQAAVLARELVAAGDVRGHGLLADALEASGRAAAALPHYAQALAAATTAAARAAAHNGRGDCLLVLGDFAAAATAYEQALRECEADGIGLVAERAETRKDLGRLAEARGDAAAAFAAFGEALAIGEAAREQLLRDPFGGSWLRVHGDQLTAIDGMLRTWQAAGAAPWTIVRALEFGRARSLLDAGGGADWQVPAAELQRVATARLLAESAEAVARADAELAVLRARAAAAPSRAAVPVAAALREFCVSQAATTWLCYWLGREQAWVIGIRGDDVFCHELGPTDRARACVAAAFAAVATPTADPAPLVPALQWFLPPAVLARCGERLAVVLDAAMTRLPIEAAPGSFAGGRVIVRVPSLAVAQRLAQRPPATGRSLVLDDAGDPGLQQRLRLDALVFSRREGDAVAAAIGEVTHRRGTEATFAALQTRGSAPPALLHISAHAVDCPGFPSQSLLLLGDGPVAMAAFAGLQLPGTVVVLSACDAAAGEQRGQEGNVGLVEGAFAAGARAVVAPIAEVNQQATADLMAWFHHRMAAGHDVAAAMASARAVLAAAPQYAHPHYWATFAVHGHGGPTTVADRWGWASRWPWLLAGGVAAVVGLLGWRLRMRSAAANGQFHGRIV